MSAVVQEGTCCDTGEAAESEREDRTLNAGFIVRRGQEEERERDRGRESEIQEQERLTGPGAICQRIGTLENDEPVTRSRLLAALILESESWQERWKSEARRSAASQGGTWTNWSPPSPRPS